MKINGSWVSALLAALCSPFASGEALEIGDGVPEVEAKAHDGEVVKLHEVAAKGWALFFFYPKAATPG